MLSTFFSDIKDSRRPQGQRYELDKILLLSVMAMLCNAKPYRDISRFIGVKFKEIKRELGLKWKKVPSYTTIRNIIMGTGPEGSGASFRASAQSQAQYGFTDNRVYIAVDGKVLRHSFDNLGDKKAIQQLMFFDSQNHLVLGHVTIDEKSNEIPALQSLLSVLEIHFALFTADALHCQKKLSTWQESTGMGCLSS